MFLVSKYNWFHQNEKLFGFPPQTNVVIFIDIVYSVEYETDSGGLLSR